MTPRAPYGSGTKPAQRADGLWVARIEAGWTAQGTRRRVTVSAKSETECKRRLKAKQRELNAARTAGAGLSVRATVKSWADEWLPRHAEKVRPTTYTTDAGAVRKWIMPTIGHRRLSDLTPADLRKLRDTITDPKQKGGPRSTTTALHAHKILLVMLKAAIVEGHAVPERVMLAPKPGKAANDRDMLTVAEARAVLEAAAKRDDFPRWAAALLQGMRQGECLGLTWQAVDLDAGTIDVSWQLQALPYKDKARGTFRTPDGYEARQLTGALHLTRPKTAAGVRTIPLVDLMRAALLKASQEWKPNPWGLVWASESGLPIRAEDDRARWHALQVDAEVKHPSGRPYHLHEARHTTVSLLLAQRVDRGTIEAIVGQSKLVESYVHVSDAQKRDALDGLAASLGLELPAIES